MSDWTAVDLFSGIGGFALGLERAGVQTVAFCDNNPKCRALLRHHWPDVLIFDDVSTMTADAVPYRVRIMTGGFPCQDVSFAGPGGGLNGSRSGLWREYARLIREFRPDYVIVENVSALLSRGLGVVLGDLAALGFDAWWDCIPASAVGAHHRRDRVWIVAYPRGVEHEGFGDAFRRALAAGLHEALMAHTASERRDGRRFGAEPAGWGEPADGGQDVADAQSDGRVEGREDARGRGSGGRAGEGTGPRGCRDGETLAYPERIGQSGPGMPEDASDQAAPRSGEATHAFDGGVGGIWSTEPDVGRVAYGVPARVDRLHGLGNAVVPQIPEVIARAIIACAPATASDASTTDKG